MKAIGRKKREIRQDVAIKYLGVIMFAQVLFNTTEYRNSTNEKNKLSNHHHQKSFYHRGFTNVLLRCRSVIKFTFFFNFTELK